MCRSARHFTYCVEADSQVTRGPGSGRTSKEKVADSAKCSWRFLHAVQSVTLDAMRFAALLRAAERELLAMGTYTLTEHVVSLNPNANGR